MTMSSEAIAGGTTGWPSEFMPEHYGESTASTGHPSRSDPSDLLVLVIVMGEWLSAWLLSIPGGVVIGAVAALLVGRLARLRGQPVGRWSIAALALVSLAGFHSVRQHTLAVADVGQFAGWATVVDDPQPYANSTRLILGIEGRRYEVWARGRAAQRRVQGWDAGDLVHVAGERVELSAERARRVRWQHVVGGFEADWLGDRREGSPLARASNRVRSLVAEAAEVLGEPDDTLFTGLVIGDDRNQPPEMLSRFRRTGLSHLTAVSGQNVALVLAAASPALGLLTGRRRTLVTLGLIGWFIVITRLEPSILRAGAMASLAVAARAGGREGSPLRLLGLAVGALIIIDPVIASSVGFQLSVGATSGVIVLAPRLTQWFAPCGVVALPLGVTLGAQLGVLIPSVLVFGRLPLTGLIANLLAVPVAGAVMLVGLPISIFAGLVPVTRPVLMFPLRLSVRWVDTVAAIADRLEPRNPAVGWWVHAIAAVMVLVLWGRRRRRGLLDTQGDGRIPPHR